VSGLLPTALTGVSVLLALALLVPLVWIGLRAAEVDAGRALEFLLRADTLAIVANSLILVAAVTAGSVLLGVPLAVLTVGTDLPFRRFWTVAAALPLVIPSYIGAFAFDSVLGPGTVFRGLFGTSVVLILYSYPYVFLTTRASLQSFDGRAVEAARTLGSDRLRAFRRVTLPGIAPGIAAGSLLVAFYTLSDFGTPMIMGFDVFTRAIFLEFQALNRGFAALLSLVLLAITLAVLAGESRLGSAVEGAHVAGGDRRAATVELGRWRWPALAVPGLVATLALALPLGILGTWLFRSGPGYAGGGFPFELAYVWNSLFVAAAAAAVSVLVGLPIAYLAARGRSRLAGLPERATYVGYATPGVVLGLALVFFGLRVVPALYQTAAILVFAYVIRFVPQAVGIMESSILQVDPEHGEAARTMGDSSLRSFLRVTLPQVTPGVLAGGALVFLTTMKELPATLILRPFGFETFVTYIWQVQEGGYYGQAALPALVLVGVSALSLVVILGRERPDVT
jgi:iron(III) transport system permease protein